MSEERRKKVDRPSFLVSIDKKAEEAKNNGKQTKNISDYFGKDKSQFFSINQINDNNPSTKSAREEVLEEEEEAMRDIMDDFGGNSSSNDDNIVLEEDADWEENGSSFDENTIGSEDPSDHGSEESNEEYLSEDENDMDDPIYRIDDDGNEYLAEEDDEEYGDIDPPRIRNGNGEDRPTMNRSIISSSTGRKKKKQKRPRSKNPKKGRRKNRNEEYENEDDILENLKRPEIKNDVFCAKPFLSNEDFKCIPEIYSSEWKRLGRNPVLLSYEFSEECFLNPEERDSFLASDSINGLERLTISSIKHGNLSGDEHTNRENFKAYYAKMVLMMLCRICTIGNDRSVKRLIKEHNDFMNKKKDRMFEDEESGETIELDPSDLLYSKEGTVRYQSNFCNHKAYACMLHNSSRTPTFRIVKEEEIGTDWVKIPDEIKEQLEIFRQQQISDLAQEEEDDLNDGDYEFYDSNDIAGNSKRRTPSSNDYGVPPVPDMIERPVINRTTHMVPQFDIFWETLVDSRYNRRGYRLWIRQNDPSINLGKNLEYMMDDNRQNMNKRERERTLSMDSALCFGKIVPEEFSRIFRTKNVLGSFHPINLLPEEASIDSYIYENNALHIAHLFHPFYMVSRCDLVKGVCPGQRNPENYFDMSKGRFHDIPHLSNIEKLNSYFQADILRNALELLPPFLESFPFPELMKWRSYTSFNPISFWADELPKSILHMAMRNGPLMSMLSSRADLLKVNPYIQESIDTEQFSMGSSAYGSLTCGFTDISHNNDNFDWSLMIDRAMELQERELNGELIHKEDYIEFNKRRNTVLDPLSYLGVTEEVKKKFYEEDEMLCFRAKASEKLLNTSKDQFENRTEWCNATNDLKKELLRALEKKEQKWLTEENPKIPKCYHDGLKWEQSFSAEEMWPESALCVEYSDSGNRISLWGNFILHLFDSLSEIFLLNEGEARFLAIRTMLSRNSALYEDSKGIGAFNQILHGKAGVGKSYPVECIQRISAPGHVKPLTDVTMASFNTDTNRCYEWLVFHELPRSFFSRGEKSKGSDKSSSGAGEDSTLKMLITSGFTIKERAHWEDGKSTTKTSASRAKISITGITNDPVENISAALLQRHCVDAVSVSENSISNSELSSEEHISWLRSDKCKEDRRIKNLAYWTHWLPHKLERRIGIFQDVNMDVYNILMPAYSKFLKKKYGISIGVRKQKQMRNACRAMVIIYSVYAHFMCEVSRVRGVTDYGTFRRMSSTDFLGIEQHMVFTEEMFVTMMTLFHRIILPTIESEVMHSIVKLLSKSSIIHPQLINPDTDQTFEKFKLRFRDNNNQIEYNVHDDTNQSSQQESEDDLGEEPDINNSHTSISKNAFKKNLPSSSSSNGRSLFFHGINQEDSNDRFIQRVQGYNRACSGVIIEEDEVINSQGPSQNNNTIQNGINSSLVSLNGQVQSITENNDEINPRRPRRIWDENYCYLGKRMKDIVDSIKSVMSNEYPESLIYSVLNHFREKTVTVKDMNNPSKKITTKVLIYEQISRRQNTGGYGYNNFYSSKQGGWFVNSASPFEHFPSFHIDDDLKEFIEKDTSFKATYMTLLPFKNSPGYLSILKTIDIGPKDKPFVRDNPLPPSISWNTTVNNNMESIEDQINIRASVSCHDVDEHPDFIAYLNHYSSCAVKIPFDLDKVHNFFLDPLKMAFKCARYREFHYKGHYERYPIMHKYPSDKIKEIESRDRLLKTQKELQRKYESKMISKEQYHSKLRELSITKILVESIHDPNFPIGLSEQETEWINRLPSRKRISVYNPFPSLGNSSETISDLSMSSNGPLTDQELSIGIFDDMSCDSLDDAPFSKRSENIISRHSVNSLPPPPRYNNSTKKSSKRKSNAITIGDVTFEDNFSPNHKSFGSISSSFNTRSLSEENTLSLSSSSSSSSSLIRSSSHRHSRRRKHSNTSTRRNNNQSNLSNSIRPFRDIGREDFFS